MRVAITIEWLPFDVLHDEVRQPIGRATTIEQEADIGMREGRKNLTFFAKATQDEAGTGEFVASRATYELGERLLFASLLFESAPSYGAARRGESRTFVRKLRFCKHPLTQFDLLK